MEMEKIEAFDQSEQTPGAHTPFFDSFLHAPACLRVRVVSNEPAAAAGRSGSRLSASEPYQPLGHQRQRFRHPAFSGGGTRAAAFSYGVLKELSKFRYRTQPERELFDPAAGAAQRIDWGRDQVFCAGHEIFSLFGNAFAELLGAAHFFDCAHSVNLTDPFFDQCIGKDPESAEAGSDCVDVQIAVR